MEERTKGIIKNFLTIFGIAVGIAASSYGIMMGILHAQKPQKEYNKEISKLASNIGQQVCDDLAADGKFQFENGKVVFSYLKTDFEGVKNETKTTEGNYMTAFGTIQDAVNTETGVKSDVAFKTEYKMETSKVDKYWDLRALNENFDDWFKLNNIEYNDTEALKFGITNDESLQKFTNGLAEVQKSYNSSVLKKPDALLPIYSKAELVTKDGVNFARLTLDGIEGYEKKEANTAAGFTFGYIAYNQASMSDTYKDYALPIAFTTGYAASELLATKSVDNYYFTQTFEVQIPENMTDFSEKSLRDFVISKISDGEKISCNLDYLSAKLNNVQFNKKINEKVDGMTME